MSNHPVSPVYRFGRFTLDGNEKQLLSAGAPIAINPRYFDALLLLVRNPGALITKERFFDEVWNGVIVGDEALTQCIKSLRKALGDGHREPRYIATVPKRGYRFIADVATLSYETSAAPRARPPKDHALPPLALALAGTAGGGAAGLVGGIVYGLAAVGSGGGSALSILLVLALLTAGIGTLGALGVTAGMAVVSRLLRRDWLFSIGGAAAGGLVMGSLFNIFGTDSLHLLFGRAPAQFTGGLEGAALGAALAAGARLGGRAPGRWAPALGAGIATAAAGIFISLMGGKLMGGSLAALIGSFRESRLELDAIGRLAGEPMFGPAAQTLAAGLEGLLFGLGVVAAILLRRRLASPISHTPS